LPASPTDDDLRVLAYQQIDSWDSPLFRYATVDRPYAYSAVGSLPGVLGMEHELALERLFPHMPTEFRVVEHGHATRAPPVRRFRVGGL